MPGTKQRSTNRGKHSSNKNISIRDSGSMAQGTSKKRGQKHFKIQNTKSVETQCLLGKTV